MKKVTNQNVSELTEEVEMDDKLEQVVREISRGKKDSEIDSDYVPVDFAAYTIRDSKQDLGISDFESAHLSDQLLESEKIWRISSLTASVDDITSIQVTL